MLLILREREREREGEREREIGGGGELERPVREERPLKTSMHFS